MESPLNMENVPQTQLDIGMAKAKPVKLGWTAEECDKIVNVLNELLANYTVHYQKLRNFHWNIKGPEFFSLHKQFEIQYKEALENIDQIAERIRIFGKAPLSTLKDYLKISEIEETGTDLSPEIMVREVVSDYSILLQYMYSVSEVAVEQEDAGTDEMIAGFIRKLETHHWMLSAFLAK